MLQFCTFIRATGGLAITTRIVLYSVFRTAVWVAQSSAHRIMICPTNRTARIVCQAPRRQHHSVDLLKDLVVQVRGRVDYKTAALCYKAVKLQHYLRISLVFSRHTESRAFWDHLRQTYTVLCTVNTVFIDKHCWSSVLMLRPRHFGTVLISLIVRAGTADSFTSFRSQLKTFCSRSAARASDTPTCTKVVTVYKHEKRLCV